MSFLSGLGNVFSSVAKVATGFLGGGPIGAGLSILMGGLSGKGGGFDLSSLISPITKGLSDVLGGLFQPKFDQFQNQFNNFTQNLTNQFPQLQQPAFAGPAQQLQGTEDRLVGLENNLSDQLDKAVAGLNENSSPADIAKAQAQIQKLTRMMDTISNIMKTIHETKQNTIRNIRN